MPLFSARAGAHGNHHASRAKRDPGFGEGQVLKGMAFRQKPFELRLKLFDALHDPRFACSETGFQRARGELERQKRTVNKFSEGEM